MNKKVYFLTGASSGFGFETLKLLLQNENNIIYTSVLNEEEYDKLTNLGAKPLFMDVRKQDQVQQAVNKIIENEGVIDALLANAGYGSYGVVEAVNEEEFQKQFDVNVFGVVRTIQAVLPYMRKRRSGRIVVTTSVVSRVTFPGIGFYSGTKHAIKSITTALRQEVKELNIQVVLIEPGAVNTNFLETAYESLNISKSDDDYKILVGQLQDFMNHQYGKAPNAHHTSKKMYEALTKNKPRKVYRTTLDSKYMSIFSRILGESIYDYLILAYYKMISRKKH